MFFMHPISLAVSLFGAIAYALYLRGRRAMRLLLRFTFPMMLIAAVVNPAFNHEGITILTYLASTFVIYWVFGRNKKYSELH